MSDLRSSALMNQLTPAEQAFAKDYAKLRLEVKMLRGALASAQQSYKELQLFLLAILRQMPEREIRFRAEDLESYKEFQDAWVFKSEYDPSVHEQVLRLEEKDG